ncbi:MAG: asparagine synthase (glutamine-hydrolyzing), partial [Magnetococcales bacterium]|nr:asparagine synthase (glutamine-hydrolyzing) [Magnetococcales bacterium]
MCGVVGALVFSNSDFRVTPPYLETMRDTMMHRGPDGAGIWISDNGRIGLGHRRLAIIDLSEAAAQPMASHDGRFRLSFNGEIYNHAEIRAELKQLYPERPWQSNHSDTEVILHAFHAWGIDCLHKFRGMFAFALWDNRERQLWLVRDRIGIKPLYYSRLNGRLTFASEIKALLADPQQKRAVNERSFYDYLSFITTPAPHTLFDGIKKIPAGCWLRIDQDGRITENRYWEVWDHTDPMTALSDDEIAERLLAELEESVALRKVSDVPVGVFLSGGIDSSVNAALFSRGESPESINTFSIGYEQTYDSYQNELHFAKMMADRVGANYHEHRLVLDDLLDFLPTMVHLQDEPIADPVCMPVYYVSKLARDNGTIVCQVGEGADELFWGYQGWKDNMAQQRRLDRIPRFLQHLVVSGLTTLGKVRSHPYEHMRRSMHDQPIFWSSNDAFTEKQKQTILSPTMRKRFAHYTSWESMIPIRRRFLEKSWQPDTLSWMSYSDLNLRLPELLLMRVDKMSMGVSLEGRVPFLDHKFVELAMSIPTAVKTRDGELKAILKRSID